MLRRSLAQKFTPAAMNLCSLRYISAEKFLLRESMRNGFVVVAVVRVSRQSANCRNTSL